MEEKHWNQPLAECKADSEKVIVDMERNIWQEAGQKHIFESKRENVDLQLESLYRERLAEVHTAVKKRLVSEYLTSDPEANKLFSVFLCTCRLNQGVLWFDYEGKHKLFL